MLTMAPSILCVIFGVLFMFVEGLVNTYTNKMYLDEEQLYLMQWSYNNTHISIALTVNNTGWIGFGVSPDGEMPYSDVAIGWVDDTTGIAYLQDGHTVCRCTPVLNESQNVYLISGSQIDGQTIIEFVRPLGNCNDPENDLPINVGTTHVIFSYNPYDPDINDIDGTMQEHTYKNSILLNLLSNDYQNQTIESDAVEFNLTVNDFIIPAEDTTYWCKILELPVLNTTAHMIKFAPLITPGNEGFVHHMLLYLCPSTLVNKEHIGLEMNCDSFSTSNLSEAACTYAAVLSAWAIGGAPFTLPSHVGYELSGTSSVQYVVLQIHYTNYWLISNQIDNSGMTVWYTPTLRQYSGAILTVGLSVNDAQFIPPGLPYAKNIGFCYSNCTSKGLTQPTKIFANLLHAHTHGVALTLKQIRNGVLINIINENPDYDFNYQQTDVFSQEIEILPEDELVLECYYNTSNTTTMVFGGESTKNEMCLSFLSVYPVPILRQCFSSLTLESIAYWMTHEVPHGSFYPTKSCTNCNLNDYFYNISVSGSGEAYANLWEYGQQHDYCLDVNVDYIADIDTMDPIQIISSNYTNFTSCIPSNSSSSNTTYTLIDEYKKHNKRKHRHN